MTATLPAISSSAPAKLVLSGEYAVLAGATALVLALDRRVHCELIPATSGWTFESSGFDTANVHHTRERLLDPEPLAASDPAALCHRLLQRVAAIDGDLARLPDGAAVHIDSSACYHDGRKFGLGSSAAVCVALGGALSAWLAPDLFPVGDFPIGDASRQIGASGPSDRLPWMLTAHAAAQGGGSGLDVAAALHGGCIAFRRVEDRSPQIRPVQLPAGIHLAFVYTGSSTATAPRVRAFDRWRSGQTPQPLAALIAAADALPATLPAADHFMAQLTTYVDALAALDVAASLGIFSTHHQLLTRIGHRTGIVYKPSGAGGGDMGVAFSTNVADLEAFAVQARAAGFQLPAMEPEHDGLRVTNQQR